MTRPRGTGGGLNLLWRVVRLDLFEVPLTSMAVLLAYSSLTRITRDFPPWSHDQLVKLAWL
jgi:hypothetical protein